MICAIWDAHYGVGGFMYGMVNDGIRKFVVENHGESEWAEICRAAGVADQYFDTLSTAPDAVTYDLVGAICERFNIGPETALQAFGEYWIEFARQTAWGKLLDFSGEGFIGCLESLDEMHERIAATLPHLKPPSFELEEISDTTFHLHYTSHRPGLAPMVSGLILGMAKHFDVDVRVEHLPNTSEETGTEVFVIELVTQDACVHVAA